MKLADQYVYSPIDFVGDCYAAGFRVGKGLANIVAIAFPETANTYDPKITNTAGNTPPSTDRGILEINSYWHPEVSDECAFDPACAAIQAFRISKQGTDFTPWATYNNGSYKNYLKQTWMAIDAFQRIQKISADRDAQAAQVAQLQQTLTAEQAKSADLVRRLNDLQAQYNQLKSADQTTVATLQSQLSDAQSQRDAAVVRAESAEGRIQQITTNLDSYLKDFRTEMLGS